MPKSRTVQIRPYQQRAAKAVLRAHADHKSTCVVSPQGSGKTVVMALIAKYLLKKNRRSLILCYRREAVHQTVAHLKALGVSSTDVGLILSGFSREPKKRIQVASWASLLQTSYPRASCVLVDEAHHIMSNTYLKLVTHYKKARADLAGFTATPYRMDNRGLGDVFDRLYVAVQPSELIRAGWLGNPRIFTISDGLMPDLRAIRRASNGDFLPGELQRAMDRDELVGNIVEHWKRRAQGRQTLVFAVGIEHSQHIADRFRRAGVRAGHVDATTSVEKRERVLDDFREKRVQVLCNCMILSESFDLPACQAVVLARPTASFTLAQQQAGRALRPYGKQRPILLDHAQNCAAFGLPHSDRDHRLVFSDAVATNAARLRICPKCGWTGPASTKRCPECRYVFTKRDRIRLVGETRDFLVEVEVKVIHEIRRRLERLAKTQGAPRGWVTKVMRAFSLDVAA